MVLGRGVRPLALSGIAFALVAAACGVDRTPYVRENERLLASLPEVPGAERVKTDSSPYYLSEMGPADGYTTNVVYEAPLGMTDQEVVDFYVRNLEENWEYCFEDIPIAVAGTGEQRGSILLVHFFRETAMMSVNTDGMVPGGLRTFEIAVDHRSYRNFCTGEELR